MSEKIYAIASDIHGSAKWCEKFLAAAENAGAEKLLLLGDLLYHGPRNDLPEEYDTKRVTKLLSAVKEKIVCVRGNCEAEVDQMVLPFPCLADYALFPYVYCGGGDCGKDGDCGKSGEKFANLFLTHGHLYSAENPPLLNAGDVLLNGHFHVPCHKKLENGAYYLNCGSVSLPKENSHHSFVLLQGGKFAWIDLATGKPFDEFSL